MEGLQRCRYWFNGVSLFFHPLRLVLLILVCFGNVGAAFYNLTTIPFDQGYIPLFGDGNLVRSPDGKGVRLLLDRFTGSGFISSNLYNHGFFSANIKLPSDYTAGICVAFYLGGNEGRFVDIF